MEFKGFKEDEQTKTLFCKFGKDKNGKELLNVVELSCGGTLPSVDQRAKRGWIMCHKTVLSVYPKHMEALNEQHPELFAQIFEEEKPKRGRPAKEQNQEAE